MQRLFTSTDVTPTRAAAGAEDFYAMQRGGACSHYILDATFYADVTVASARLTMSIINTFNRR